MLGRECSPDGAVVAITDIITGLALLVVKVGPGQTQSCSLATPALWSSEEEA